MTRSMMFLRAITVTAALASHVAWAETVERLSVTDIKPLLTRAIDRGSAHGVLTGEAARYVRQKFACTTPIEIDVRSLHALPRRGCQRLEVTTRQKDVLVQGKRSDQELVYQLSYCRDGGLATGH
jgi:hypothetical protein